MAIRASEVTVRSASPVADWLAGQLSDHTRRAYAADIRQFLGFLGSSDLSTAARADVSRFRGWLVQRYAPATVNRKMSAVRQLFLEASRRGICPNIAEGIAGHRTEGNCSTTRCPSTEEVRSLFASLEGNGIRNVRDHALLSMLARLGLRRDEVSKIRRGDISQSQGFTVLTVHGKGSKDRQLKLGGAALDAVRKLLRLVSQSPEAPLFQEVKANGKVRFTGRGLSPNGIYYIVRSRLGEAGIEGCSPHSLRHWFITQARRNGCDLHKVQRAAGHADPRTTERYDHSWQDLEDSATDYIIL